MRRCRYRTTYIKEGEVSESFAYIAVDGLHGGFEEVILHHAVYGAQFAKEFGIMHALTVCEFHAEGACAGFQMYVGDTVEAEVEEVRSDIFGVEGHAQESV